MGNERIAQQMNKLVETENIWVPPPRRNQKTSEWRASYISKILSNREVIGEYTPHLKVEGKRKPMEELMIPDYFPPAIPQDLFYKVLKLMKDRAKVNGNAGGKTGKATNLFKNVIQCGLCKKPMHYIDKGAPPKGGQYLHCDSSRQKYWDQL